MELSVCDFACWLVIAFCAGVWFNELLVTRAWKRTARRWEEVATKTWRRSAEILKEARRCPTS